MIEEKLWTTSLYFYESTQGNNKYLKEKILNFKDNKSSRQISNVRGWQSESDLIFKEEFQILRSFIHASFGSLCNNLYPCNCTSFLSLVVIFKNFIFLKYKALISPIVIIVGEYSNLPTNKLGLLFFFPKIIESFDNIGTLLNV